ncbi:hypothetical protein [Paracoccus suum]|nr:hypothetical protein [Paracoccus suum]
MTSTIKLYLGAHKTATTHLQGILIKNADLLEAAGTSVTAPRQLRPDWLEMYFAAVRQQVKKPERGPRPDTRTALRRVMPEANDWILTDENIIGTPRQVLKDGGFYANTRQRLETLKEVFGDRQIEVYFSVRRYGDFFSSMYSEIVRNQGFIPAEEYAGAFDPMAWSWSSVIEPMVDVFGESAVTIWDFASFRDLLPDLVNRLTGTDLGPRLVAEYAPEATRPSLSQKTLDVLADLAPAIGPTNCLPLTEMINAKYAVASGYAPGSPYPENERQRINARYLPDLESYKARWGGVNFL